MTYSCYFYRGFSVVDDVYHSVITNTDAPFIVATLEFLAALRSWIIGQTVEMRDNTLDQFRGETFQFLPCACFQRNGILSHAVCRA